MTTDHRPELQGKVVVITGAARGMGRAYAGGFLSAGAKVVATDKSWAGVEDFRRELESGGDALVADMDVTDEAQIDQVCEATMAKFGTVDVIINNAALLNMILFPPAGRPTTLETTPAHWAKALDVNVVGPLRVMRAFCKPMIQQRPSASVDGKSDYGRWGDSVVIRKNGAERLGARPQTLHELV